MNIQGDLQAKGRTYVIEFLEEGEAKSQSYEVTNYQSKYVLSY